MNRSPAIQFIVVGVLILAFQSGLAVADERPNIVFFFADDQTAGALGCYGNGIAQTPNIDSLARRGTRFENAFVSHSICWVSRTTILTGLTGRSYGTPGQRDLARPEAVAELYSDLLREAGYRTGYFGKWHAKMPSGFKREDHFDSFEAIGRNPFFKTMPDGSLRHETDLIVDRGIEFLEKQPKDQPFALNLWFNACHAEDSDRRPGIGHFPWPQSADGMYDQTNIPGPRLNDPSIFEALPNFLKTTINRERYFWRWNTEFKYQTNVRAYYRMVSGIDHAIGRFLKSLADRGLDRNTIIVYSADNGYYMGNRGLAGKWSHYEESLRVPMIVADPRVAEQQQGKVVDAIALNLDLPATFLDWAEIEIPERYQGRSLRPIVEEAIPEDWRQESFHEHFAVRNRIPAFEGLRNSRFKYVRYVDHGRFEFLHDLQEDPHELVNLAGETRYADVMEEMRARTDQRVTELGGPLLEPTAEFTSSTKPHPEAAALVGASVDRDGYVQVFNQRSLQGWAGDLDCWSIKDGVLVATSDRGLKEDAYLTWKFSTIRNFDLRAQVKIGASGRGGLHYRSICRPDLSLDSVSGYELRFNAQRPELAGMLNESGGRGQLALNGMKVIIDPQGRSWVAKKDASNPVEPDEWHEYRIQAMGNHLQHWIDGQPILEVFDFDAEHRSLEGVLALHLPAETDMSLQVREIKIKHLPDDLPLTDSEDHPIPKNAVLLQSRESNQR